MHGLARRFRRFALAFLCLATIAPAATRAGSLTSATAPGAPGAAPYWAVGRKDGVGSALGTASNVWYTLAGGRLTEVFYPTTDTPDVTSLSFVVTDGKSFADRQSIDTTCLTVHPDPRSEQYVVTCRGRRAAYMLATTFFSDPRRPTVLIHVQLSHPSGLQPLRVYVRYDPALNANGTGDSGRVAGAALLAHDDSGHYGPVASALLASPPLLSGTTGYAGTASDPEASFQGHHAAGPAYAAAGPGNIVQGAFVPLRSDGTADLGLGFAPSEAAAERTAAASLAQPFAGTERAFIAGWHRYAAGLRQPDGRFSAAERDQYFDAALALKASEDKRFPGAIVASLSTPWGQSVAADQNSGQGYHRVWSRDLYEMATGMAAAGDSATAHDILRYMLTTLDQADGGVAQNTLVDGNPVDGGIQLDGVAYPLILAWSLGVDDGATYVSRLRQMADYLVRTGPITDQERWEEDSGYSPSTIAAEIAGLASAAAIAEKNGDRARALVYRGVADDWQRNVKSWTVTSTGPLAHRPYFIRLDDNADPNDGGSLQIAGGAGRDERSVVDSGFLELVRLGILPANDRDVVASLGVVDATIRVTTAEGPAWYRYNFDTYGDSASGAPWNSTALQGTGHPWPVLGGERGEYDLTDGRVTDALASLQTMQGFATATGLIPEQIWERKSVPPSPAGTPPLAASIGMATGQADGSATPLNWALGQYLRLLMDVQSGTLLDQPSITRERYVTHRVEQARLAVTSPAANVTGSSARSLIIRGTAAPGARVAILVTSETATRAYGTVAGSDGGFSLTIGVPSAYSTRIAVAAQDPAGRTALVLRRVRQ